MNYLKPTSLSHFLRSCKKECDIPREGVLSGSIPTWLKGCLLRVGSGLLEIGPDRYKHAFDGLALMHRFSFKNGHVTYQSKFLRSDTYRKNMKANRILVSEFGTRGVPDPCKSIFHRFSSLFKMEMTDNDLVNFVTYSGAVYACTESNFIWRINPKDLESMQKVNLHKYVPVDGALAHAHETSNGKVYNMGSSFGFNSSYALLEFPPTDQTCSNTFEKGRVICRIPSSKKGNLSYLHSFAITDNYFIFVEQPLYMSMLRLLWAQFVAGSYADAMYFDDNALCRFHVIRRSDGTLLESNYLAKAFMVFHHINAFEENGHLVVDMSCYNTGDVVRSLYVEALQELSKSSSPNWKPFQSEARRYVLPIAAADSAKKDGGSLVSLSNSKATAHKLADGSIMCHPEPIIKTEIWHPELPRINYEAFNGKKYQYFYAIARKGDNDEMHLVKVDTDKKSAINWGENDVIPSEPVFIAHPEANGKDEDNGVLLASLLYRTDECKVSMAVLCAKTMQEIGRVTFQTESAVPGDFHGKFVSQV